VASYTAYGDAQGAVAGRSLPGPLGRLCRGPSRAGFARRPSDATPLPRQKERGPGLLCPGPLSVVVCFFLLTLFL
jgi:hypothetical protein